MTVGELLAFCRAELSALGRPARPDAEILVAAAAGVPRSALFLDAGRDAGFAVERLRSFIGRRAAGEPVQYILGAWDFFGREFVLSRDTLIPRPETEGLVEAVLRSLRRTGRRARIVLDAGTGCGAIAATLAAELPGLSVVATDVSRGALRVALANAARLGVGKRLFFLCADGYSALKTGDRFDVVVSNPPYVSEREWVSLPAEVRDFEPPGALLGGPDGLSVIRRLVAGAQDYLVPGGELWCEIGETQGEAVARLPVGSLRFDGVSKDPAGRDRYAAWKKRGQQSS